MLTGNNMNHKEITKIGFVSKHQLKVFYKKEKIEIKQNKTKTKNIPVFAGGVYVSLPKEQLQFLIDAHGVNEVLGINGDTTKLNCLSMLCESIISTARNYETGEII
jgi:hypothetical protein